MDGAEACWTTEDEEEWIFQDGTLRPKMHSSQGEGSPFEYCNFMGP